LGPVPIMTTNVHKIMMTCAYQGMNRLYELDSSNQFLAGEAANYLSMENESVFYVSAKMISDDMGVLSYQSTYHSPTISPIKYILWGLD